MIGRKEADRDATLSFRAAIWTRMADIGIDSPYALAQRLQGRVDPQTLYNYLCDGRELSADKLEAVFNALGIGLAILPDATRTTGTTRRRCPIHSHHNVTPSRSQETGS